MTQFPKLTEDLSKRIEAAHTKGCYAPDIAICETIYATGYIEKEGGYPYVFLSDIPEIFHDYLNRKAIGSGCPAFREESTAFWLYDFNRWLGAIGVKLETSIQIHDPAPFLLPDPDDTHI